MERPLIVSASALTAGIVLASLISVPDVPLLILLCYSLAIFIFAIRKGKTAAAILLLSLSIFTLGMLDMNIYCYHGPPETHISRYAGPDRLAVDGVISEFPQRSSENTDLTISVFSVFADGDRPVSVQGKILLTVKPDLPFKYGDIVRFRTRLRVPNNFNNPGGFDYSRYLRYRGILVRGYIADAAGIVVLREGYGNPFLLLLSSYRSQIKRLISENAQSPVAEIIQASILGNQKEVPREVMDKFNLTGTSHIIAISGFNMGIVALFAVFITRMVMSAFPWLLLRFDWQRVSAIVAAILVILYTFIAGAGISVVRATLMILVFMSALLLGKFRDLGNTLALAALIILVISPYDLFDISFQLSFTAVIALLVITPRLTGMIPIRKDEQPDRLRRLTGKALRGILLFLAVTIAATLGTLPLIVFYFNRVSTVVLASNLLVVPILGIAAIPIALGIVLFLPFSETMAVLFIKIAGWLVEVSLKLVDFFASLPYSSFFVTTPTVIEITAYYALLFSVVKLLDYGHRQKTGDESGSATDSPGLQRPAGLLLAIFLLVIFFVGDIIYLHGKNRNTGLLRLTAIEVGQGA
ncbi:MAG: ComEC/Rec2 family competence protein, partial [Syntrophales bacterium]|nr:ComEC/Rec2 family competence protein [Syntrophales bacterium]